MLVPIPYSFLKINYLVDINMFASFNGNTAVTLQDIKKIQYYGRTDGQLENSRHFTNTVCVCVCEGLLQGRRIKTDTVKMCCLLFSLLVVTFLFFVCSYFIDNYSNINTYGIFFIKLYLFYERFCIKSYYAVKMYSSHAVEDIIKLTRFKHLDLNAAFPLFNPNSPCLQSKFHLLCHFKRNNQCG